MALGLLNPDNGSLGCWLQLQNPSKDTNDSKSVKSVEETAEPLYYASLYGLTSVVCMLIDQKVNINSQGGCYGTPLQAAASNLQREQKVILSDRERGLSKKGKPSKLHAETIYLLVENGADVKIRGGVWGTALQAAASHGNLEIVEFLLQHGAEVDVEGGYLGSPLQAAAHSGNARMVQVLLQHEASIGASNGEYGTALQAAAIWGHEEVVRHLLSRGAAVNIEGGKFGSALQAAVYGGFESITQMLLESGAKINSPDEEYRGSALSLAARRGHQNLVKMLLAKGARSETALLGAAEHGDANTVRMLLLADDDFVCPRVPAEKMVNILQAAVMSGSLDMVEDLLSHGAEINGFGGEYGFAIHAAAWFSHDHIVQLLLDRGGDANVEHSAYASSLYQAATGGPTPDRSREPKLTRDNYDDLLLCINVGEVVSARLPSFGESVRKGSPDGYLKTLRLLLQNGAQVNQMTGYYGTALQAASVNGYEPSVHLLIEHGAEINACVGYYGTALQAACAHGHTAVVHLLLQHGASVIIQGGQHGSALHAAAAGGHVAIVKLLLDHGADYTLRASLSDIGVKILTSPLHFAVGSGSEEVVRILLDGGADPNMLDNARSTPLHFAVRTGNEVAVKLLIRRGADFSRIDCFGQTALQMAVQYKERRLQNLILEHMERLGLPVPKSDLEFDTSTKLECALCDNCLEAVPVNEEFYQCSVCEDQEYGLCLQGAHLYLDCPRGQLLSLRCVMTERNRDPGGFTGLG